MTGDNKNEPEAGDSRKPEEAQEIPLSQAEFEQLVDVFATLRQWDFERRRKQKDAQVDNSRTRS